MIRKISFSYLADLDKSGAFAPTMPLGAGNLYPKMSKFLIKSETWEETNKVEQYDYSYELDSDKYVAKVWVKRDGALISSRTNGWQ